MVKQTLGFDCVLSEGETVLWHHHGATQVQPKPVSAKMMIFFHAFYGVVFVGYIYNLWRLRDELTSNTMILGVFAGCLGLAALGRMYFTFAKKNPISLYENVLVTNFRVVLSKASLNGVVGQSEIPMASINKITPDFVMGCPAITFKLNAEKNSVATVYGNIDVEKTIGIINNELTNVMQNK